MNHPTETLRMEPDALSRILSYHERSKHRHERYAAGPDTLDWDAQPDPFREFAGAPRIALPAPGRTLPASYAALFAPGAIVPQSVGLAAIGLLLELSLGLSAWKQSGPERWAVRCNPSSGNLHPTEAYLLCVQVPGLNDGLYHYVSREHALELRCHSAPALVSSGPALHIALSSIHWREAWKYGERAFRYCQLDCGHALGALRFAAAALGWSLQVIDSVGTDELAALLGLNRDADFGRAEREEAELLLRLVPGTPGDKQSAIQPAAPALPDTASGAWSGQANLLDAHPMYRWPLIDEVARASRKPATTCAPDAVDDALMPPRQPRTGVAAPAASTLIRQRRSAQQFERSAMLDQTRFFQMLDALLPRTGAPWDDGHAPRIHLILFVHRVEGLAPGLYALPRSAAGERQLRAALSAGFAWTHVDQAPAQLPLYLLLRQDLTGIARMMNCRQAIAADSAFTLAMLAEFEPVLRPAPWRYRDLYRDAGLLGQALYLEAEAVGMRGTGIGCFLDDDCHALLGLADRSLQSLYHFTVGTPLTDSRIASLPPYPPPAADHHTQDKETR